MLMKLTVEFLWGSFKNRKRNDCFFNVNMQNKKTRSYAYNSNSFSLTQTESAETAKIL